MIEAVQGAFQVDAAEGSRRRARMAVLVACSEHDRGERDRHQHVPLPPGRLPRAPERHGDQGLGEEHERHRDGQRQGAAACAVDPQVPPRREQVRRHGERQQRPAATARVRTRSRDRGVRTRPPRPSPTRSTRRRGPRASAPAAGAASPRCARPSRSRRAPRTPTARMRPAGVASTNPPFGPSSTTPGVANACSARNPALVSSTIDTRKSRSSPLRRATSLTIRPRATLIRATPNTSQKCDGWCSQCTSSDGNPSIRASPASGTISAAARNQGEGPAVRDASSIAPSCRVIRSCASPIRPTGR